jgi:nicotinate-nucleotide adenylyltransferase
MLVTYVLSVGGFDRVLVVPTYEHAFHKPLSRFEDRLEMVRRSMAPFPNVEVSAVESELPTPSRTVATLSLLRERHPCHRFRLVVGSDVLAETHKWHAFERVLELAPPYVVGRAGYPPPVPGAPTLPDISSTRVRKLLLERLEPEVMDQLCRLLPSSVLDYIDASGLYR